MIKARKIASEFDISYDTVFAINYEQFGFRKMCAEWVSHLLIES